MEFSHVVRRRYMCRSFDDRPVPDDKIEAILDLARRFPSAGHTQPQEFIVVRDEQTKIALGRAALEQMYVAEAPVVIVTISDTRRSARRYGRRGVEFYSVIDGAFASLLVLLASVEQELGAVFVGAYDDDAVREILGLPDHVRPIGIIPIGYCAEGPDRARRRSPGEIVHNERYG